MSATAQIECFSIGTQEDQTKWFQTYSGKQFHPYCPTVDEIDIEDIAQSLSMQCRFAGHLEKFYSVAEHSVRVSQLVEYKFQFDALMHDASEAYLSDVLRPLKYSSFFSEYFKLEEIVEQRIAEKFGLSVPRDPSIKHADNIMLITEHRDLRKPGSLLWTDFEKWPTPLATTLVPWTQLEAKHTFLKTFHMLKGSN